MDYQTTSEISNGNQVHFGKRVGNVEVFFVERQSLNGNLKVVDLDLIIYIINIY